MVKDLARELENTPGMDDPSQISVIIKHLANGRISDETIEKALPPEKKRKHKPYERYQDTEINGVDFQRPVTVASDGSTHTDDRIPLSTDKGKGVFIPDEAEDEEEEEQEHKQQEASLQQLQQYKIILSAALLRGLGKLMLQKAEKAPNKKNFCIEHDITTKELFVYEAEEGEERNALGDDER
jgi:hypothetical protein